MITRQVHPPNIEFPFSSLDSFITPTERFYIRSHFPTPELAADQWKLRVEGHVERPFELGYDELRKLGSVDQTALLECAGNSRIFLKPPQIGVRWEQGAVGNAKWTGTPLSLLLARAGVKPGAVDVILEGYDKGRIEAPSPPSPGEIHFARSLPLAKAQEPQVLLAWKMNGEELTPDHGYPVRAIVAGWYGMASIKWLKRIIVTDKPFDGYFQTFSYSMWRRDERGVPSLAPIGPIDVKSQIARPAAYEVVPQGSRYRVFGAAWSGNTDIAKVEISTDGGVTWNVATLDAKAAPLSWRLFNFDWQTPQRASRVTLMARATDALGRAQAMERDHDRRDTMITHVQSIPVFVR
ncbi:MAG: sulfite oxidase [Planctomycetes bacterium]|nr:sulfite oxidase [Planctomycetota bacterium]